jgi:3-oxoacyl-[acyl-carrier protein] reductase
MTAAEARRQGCALVTGGGRGIGAATARALAAEGWPVAIGYRERAAAADAVAEEIRDAGGTAEAFGGDVADGEQLRRLFAQVTERFGPVLVLVNNAGVRADALSLDLDEKAWSEVLDTNLTAAFRATRIALRPMVRARFGRIVNVASVAGLRANAGQANYSASKAGLIGLTRTVAVEVARRNVTVNAVAPGLVRTEMSEDVAQEIVAATPARRAGTPEEVAACVRFLASEDAGYVTGHTLTVDGGLSA